ncbi:DUF624 domain-containing protein [Enterococcus thailandicus]|uniref:DUF624 domain-containing protein n=1 Tax=Enterococcus thailandicus TaxID=417368 RepID=UPI003BCD5328
MQKIFSTEGKIYEGMQRIYQVLLLTIIFILSCLPVLTIGAAMASAYGTAYKMVDHREGVLYKEYVHQFKQNFVLATEMWLLILGVSSGVFFLLPFIQPLLIGNKIAYYLVMLFVTLLVLMGLYLFPLIARFENNLTGTLVNACILSLKHLPSSILLFFITIGGGIMLPLYLPSLLFAWLFLGIGTIIFIKAKLLLGVFHSYENLEEGS